MINGRYFSQVFKQLVRRLLQGKALTIEEAADVLSLKDNKPEVDDFVTALHLLDSAQVNLSLHSSLAATNLFADAS